MSLRRVISDAEEICGEDIAAAGEALPSIGILVATMDIENVTAALDAEIRPAFPSKSVTASMELDGLVKQENFACTNATLIRTQNEGAPSATIVESMEGDVITSNENVASLSEIPLNESLPKYIDRTVSSSAPQEALGDGFHAPERLEVPAAIQSLQRQYYSSSSLSGDEDEDDEPLVQNVVNTASTVNTEDDAQSPNKPQMGMSRMHSGSSSQSSSSQLARSSQNSSRDWGWFDDVHATAHSSDMALATGCILDGAIALDGAASAVGTKSGKAHRVMIVDPASDNAMAVTAPNYVLEESLSSQFLWKNSAGQRPPQPVEERAFYEKMWAQNFARSNVEYNMPVELLTATSPISLDPFADGDISDYHTAVVPSHGDPGGTVGGAGTDIAEAALVYRMNDDSRNHEMHNYAPKEVKDTSGDGTLTVLVRGDNVFGTTVSKSFARTNELGDPIAGVDTINISIASYRVVESSKHGKYAQFLVIYRQGSIRDTIGIWKRYRDFEELAHKVTQAHEGCAAALANISPLHVATDDNETEHLPNAITSWRLLKKRKRWYRCLDAGYLSLKVFLLERFLHDILFESSSPHLLRDFVGVNSVSQMLK